MKLIKVNNYNEMSWKSANILASQITLKSNSVLGLVTGDTPLGMYKELVKLYNKKEYTIAGNSGNGYNEVTVRIR